MKIFYILLIFMMASHVFAQDKWTMILTDGTVHRDVILGGMHGDTLVTAAFDKIPVEKIALLKTRQSSFLNVGTLVGFFTGLVIGKSVDAGNGLFSSLARAFNTTGGALVGALAGSALGMGFGKEEYNLSQYDTIAKTELIRSLLKQQIEAGD